MYSLKHFGDMITDSVRTDAYDAALQRAVFPGAVVLDIGAGAGIFSLLACKYGAARVYAVEPSPWADMIPQFATANGYADRITVIKDMSTNITLPEQVDVVVSDIRGQSPLFYTHIASIADARARHMKPRAVQIPQQDTLWAGMVSAPQEYAKHVRAPWETNAYGLDMRAALPLIANNFASANVKPGDVVLPGQPWYTVDYRTATNANASGTLTWTVAEATTLHYAINYFQAQTLDDIGYFSFGEPGERAVVYGYTLLPLREPVAVERGDTVTLVLHTDAVGNSTIMRWEVTTTAADGTHKASHKQSTLFALPLSNMRKRMRTYKPTLNKSAKVVAFILAQADGTRTNDEIAEALVAAFPDEYTSREAAYDAVAAAAVAHSV